MNPLRSVGGGAAAPREYYGSFLTVCAVDLRRIKYDRILGSGRYCTIIKT